MLAIPAALLWLGTGIVLVLAEVMSGSMVLLALGLAAICVSMAAYFGVGIATQLVLFCLLTGLFLLLATKLIQPLMFSRRHGSARSNASAHTIRLEPGAVVSVVEAETGLGVPHGDHQCRADQRSALERGHHRGPSWYLRHAIGRQGSSLLTP